ncbi:hypothetical protein EGH24_07555 [Halonotius terrestris]|uniref:Uncharacterized protein n=1 Tax=Halonotius terrestris TaxID=2487750 RepID=A0A8J8PCF6_9EURY|nr:hypothetical protein [Halonotius terrestris]TQQ80999.1 hypothetical protein EGH24_07555 [Halonotius terrestris]
MGETEQAQKPVGGADPPPRKQPLEVIETDRGYLLREFRRDPDKSTVFSVHHDRVKAMAAASDKLEGSHHPCLLRWDSHNSVGDIYWNDVFNTVRVEYSPILRKWVVVPKNNHFIFASTNDVKQAYEYGKDVQQQYHFKELEVCSQRGEVEKTVEHPFLRRSITDPDVKFNR